MRTPNRTAPLFTLSAIGCSLFLGVAGAEPLSIPAGDRDKMTVCTDGKSHYIAIAPHERLISQLFYGDGKNMTQVGVDPSGMLSGTSFLEPRFPNPTHNPDFRGLDMRVYSSVEYNAEKNSCELHCGERKQDLTVMSKADAKKLMTDATFVPNPRGYAPYALARDDRGTYYYVDKGVRADNKASFRIFVGKKGALKQQKMKDVASDSEGEVFSTPTGDLRFITSKDQRMYSWVQGKKENKLIALPPRENLTLIYTTLGVYQGERMGNPCDDL